MGTATSKAGAGVAALAIACAGCGGSGHSSSGSASNPSPSRSTTTAVSRSSGTAAFSWLRPQTAPAGWKLVRIPSGAVLAYPPSWRLIKTDPGTATAVVRTRDGGYRGYLNITPRQGEERLGNWRTFRIEHNHEEGDRSVMQLAYARGLRFLDGHGNCVKDAYISGSGVHYLELACLVQGAKGTTVIVGAGPPSAWARVSGSIQRAISGFRT